MATRKSNVIKHVQGQPEPEMIRNKASGWYYWHNAMWLGPIATRREARALLRHEKLIPQSHVSRMASGVTS